LDRKFADAYNSRGLAKNDLKDYTGAIDDFTEAIKIVPGFAMAYSNRGIVKINTGQKESGCLDLSRAAELGNIQASESFGNSVIDYQPPGILFMINMGD